MRIFANPDTRREGLLIIYNDKTVPPRRGTSPEGAEGVSRPRAAIMAVLCAMRRGVTTLFAPCGGHNGRPVRHAGWQRGRETPPALRATSPARRRSSYHAAKVSEPGTPSFRARNTQFQGLEHTVSKLGTHSFKRLEHTVSRPETLRIQKKASQICFHTLEMLLLLWKSHPSDKDDRGYFFTTVLPFTTYTPEGNPWSARCFSTRLRNNLPSTV